MNFPKRLDISPTGKCNLRCTFCWGPDHNIPEELDTEIWKNIISFFSKHGTKKITFTGGEPLIRKDLAELLKWAKLQELRTTLSTNTLLLNEEKALEILPFVDEIGIPIDGSNPKKNSEMRTSNDCSLSEKHFSAAMEALLRIRRLAPNIEITVRTVVSRVNKEDIINIGNVLNQQKENWDRWKIYQFVPVSIGSKYKERHYITTQDFNNICEKVSKKWFDSRIQSCSAKGRVKQYVFIDPDGEVFGVGEDEMYNRIGKFQNMSEDQKIKAISSLVES